MREIKFKAKRVDNGLWVRGWYIDGYICSDLAVADCENFMPAVWYKVDPETVCQYTGLKDINGKEIWEGDIIRVFGGESDDEFCEYDNTFVLEMPNPDHLGQIRDAENVEVIGDIHDNKELLREE